MKRPVERLRGQWNDRGFYRCSGVITTLFVRLLGTLIEDPFKERCCRATSR